MRAQKSRLFFYFFIILISFVIFLILFSRNHARRIQFEPSNAPSKEERQIRRTPVVRAIEKVMPSVVNLSTSRIINRRKSLWYQDLSKAFEQTVKNTPQSAFHFVKDTNLKIST